MERTRRTDETYQGVNMLNSLNLGLTTFCTMHCPECHTQIPKHMKEGTAKHALLEQIRRDADLIAPLQCLHLTGGEPTMHPYFRIIATSARYWFKAEKFTIEMNGSGYFKYRDIFPLFDRVFITHYVKDRVYPGNYDNTKVIELAKRDLGERLVVEPPVEHFPLIQLGRKDEPCSKWFKPGLPAAWFNGLLYPCCTTFGIDEKRGIPVTSDWRLILPNVPMGCESCCFQGT